jgi:hypothetical protein
MFAKSLYAKKPNIKTSVRNKMSVLQMYERCKNARSDINEHLPTLLSYAKQCNHITECGVRGVTSSWAFAAGLLGKTPARLIQVDLDTNQNVVNFGSIVRENGIDVVFYQQSDLTCPIEQTELLFIDTWHIYGHLKRELARWNSSVTKWIIMHDTTVDEWVGESVRNHQNIADQSKQHGYPVEEITKGLWPAIDEFLKKHPEWSLEKRFTNNNGLTVLKRNT